METKEIWKAVVGYELLYHVSNKGRVKSLERFVYKKRNNKPVVQVYKERILKPSLNKKYNYWNLPISNINDKRWKMKKVHRLVGEAFIPNPENKPQINHIDGNRLNNNLENLEWCTCQENMTHAGETGLMPTKLNPDKVRKIRKMRVDGLTLQAIGAVFNVSLQQVHNIVTFKQWTHVS